MIINTRHFGNVEIEDDKVIFFEYGIMGFSEFKNYVILYDEDSNSSNISWLQSVEEPTIALPIIDPFIIKENYAPIINDDLILSLGETTDEQLIMLVFITVPSNLELTSCNLKAPLLINTHTKKGKQVIVDNKEYEIKYNIYDMIDNIRNKKENNYACPF